MTTLARLRRALCLLLAALAAAATPAAGALTIRIAPPVLGPIGGDWTDEDANTALSPGDRLFYYVSLVNTGPDPETVASLTIDGQALSCPATAPVGTTACGAHVHTYTAADVQAGGVSLTAAAQLTTAPAPRTVTGALVTALATDVRLMASLDGSDDVDANGYLSAGDRVRYRLDVENASPVVAVHVAEALAGSPPGLLCSPVLLRPGEAGACQPATRTITSEDVARGYVALDATAVVRLPGPGATAGERVGEIRASPATPLANGVVEQIAGPVIDVDGNGVDSGDTMELRVMVENRGREPLSASQVDLTPGGTLPCGAPIALAPGDRALCATTVRVLGAADVAAGQVVSEATTRFTIGGAPGPVGTHRLVTDLGIAPDVSIDVRSRVRDLDGNGDDAGDGVSYELTVTNRGNATVSSLQVSGTRLASAACELPSAGLPPGASLACAAAGDPLTQGDLDAGVVETDIVVTARASDRLAQPARAAVSTRLSSRPDVSLAMAASPVADLDGNGQDAGDTIAYTLTVTNAGNVTLPALTVTGTPLGPVPCPVPAAGLAPGASVTCPRFVYALTQADIDGQSLVSIVTVAPVLTRSDRQAAITRAHTTASFRTGFSARPRLRITRRISRVAAPRGASVGYVLRVRNAGAATARGVVVCDRLPAALTTDSLAAEAGGSRVCWTADLPPGASRRFAFRARVSPTATPGTHVSSATARSDDGATASSRRALLVVTRAGARQPGVTG